METPKEPELKLNDPDFDKRGFLKTLESLTYLFLVLPLTAFGYVFLEREKSGGLRAVFFDDPDVYFHGAMLIGVGYILMRTVLTWRRDLLKGLSKVRAVDEKLQLARKPLIYRNALWAIGAGVGAYGLYEKGDMLYAIVFTLFLILITANRPSPNYFVKLFKLKGPEKDWMLK